MHRQADFYSLVSLLHTLVSPSPSNSSSSGSRPSNLNRETVRTYIGDAREQSIFNIFKTPDIPMLTVLLPVQLSYPTSTLLDY